MLWIREDSATAYSRHPLAKPQPSWARGTADYAPPSRDSDLESMARGRAHSSLALDVRRSFQEAPDEDPGWKIPRRRFPEIVASNQLGASAQDFSFASNTDFGGHPMDVA